MINDDSWFDHFCASAKFPFSPKNKINLAYAAVSEPMLKRNAIGNAATIIAAKRNLFELCVDEKYINITIITACIDIKNVVPNDDKVYDTPVILYNPQIAKSFS
jgi:hypothetical protein